MLFEGRRYRTVKALLRFAATAGIRPPDAGEDWVPDISRLAGDVPALVLSSSVRNDVNGKLTRNHLLACGSFLALNQSITGSPNIANGEYFLDLLGNLAGREDRIYIQDKTLGYTELGISAGQAILLAAVFTVLLPLVVLGAGIAVWLRRRHK
jgi:hypothetical protein